ncbi:MAG: hypothetical protein Wins2KO_20710 [Winogradskyella sp.]
MFYVGNVLYYQLNIDYIVDTYCVNKDKPQLQCNGKCHLAKQLNKSTGDASHDAIMNLYDSFFPVFSEYPYDIKVEGQEPCKGKKVIFTANQNYTYGFEYFHFKPPIV